MGALAAKPAHLQRIALIDLHLGRLDPEQLHH